MARAYEQLRDQVINETKWCVDFIKENHPDIDIAVELDLAKFIGNEELREITDYERGMLFAYLSIMSKIKAIEA